MERPSLPSSTSKFAQNGASPAPMMPMPFPAASPPQEEGMDIRRFLAIAKRRWLVIAGAAILSVGYSIWSAGNQVPQYEGGFQLLVEPVNSENANLANPTAEEGRSNQSSLDYSTQIAVLNSPELLSKVIEDLQASHPTINYREIVNNLNIRRIGETKILEVRYIGNEPGKVQDVLEELAESYLQYSLKERQTYLRQGIQFVDEQLPPLQEQVNQLQDELQAFRQRNGFVEPDSRSEQLSSQVTNLEQQRSTIEQQLVQLRSSQELLQQEAGMLVALEQAPTYQELLAQLRKVETEIATELTRFRPQNSTIQTLQRKRDNLLPLLQKEAERVLGTKLTASAVEIQSLQIQLRAINQAQTKLQQQIQTLPVLTRQYANLQQELEIASQSLARFLETRQKLQIEAAQREIPWQVIQEPAQTVVPIAASGGGLVQAVAIGLAAGFGLAMLLEKMDSTYHTADDLKAKVKLPMLGVLPFNQQLAENETIGVTGRRKKKKPLTVLINWSVKSIAKVSSSLSFLAMLLLDEYDSSVEFVESLRVLNTNLQMMGSTRSIRSLVISSASQSDGKSTIAYHWAKTAVAMGQRVLLVDADLRHPQLHAQLNLENKTGLSQVVSKNLDLMDAVHQVSPDEEFYLLSAGAIAPDPASILSSQKMKHLMEKAHQWFDLVIYDTPPLLGLADANLLARYTDGLVLVVRMSKTSSFALKQAVEELKAFQVPVLGMIANGQRKYNPAIGEPVLPPEEPPNHSQKQDYAIQNNIVEFPAQSEML